MTTFYDIKSTVLKGLKSHFAGVQESNRLVETFTLPVDVNNFKELIPFLKDETTFYMKSPSGTSILAVGTTRTFNNSLEFEEMDDLLQMHPDLDIVGALPFESQCELKDEWKDFRNHRFFLPKVVFHRSENETVVKINYETEVISDNLLQMSLLSEVENILSFVHREQRPLESENTVQSHNETEWNKTISDSLKEFEKGSLDKVVLARKKVLSFKNNVDSHTLFSDTKPASNLYEFFYHTQHGVSFICFTPEKLFSLEGNNIIVDSIAGTHEDGNFLLNSKKDIEEHRFVSNYVRKTLGTIGDNVRELFKEKILKLHAFSHIHSKFSAEIKVGTGYWDIIKTLHPTPAVGGFPKQKSLDYILKNENLERGLYAGPIGHLSKNNCEIAVGIRSALIQEDKIHIYGGAGIVKESQPTNEWEETNKKIESVQCLML